ncbi:hypothetical protein [Dictyobacter aurantiacus]|uniref:Topology modulation protein n=1 Tax=Dictyobacter aurantiacus TaxID=1936993 RepID=A0A401ZRL9_9CHLR|nr:hypothetical protein [Dictyobacter aurantiacus]GCE09434.1 hypothetical protein KDAU_67630 [Dictyobacter aurantiacus]
MVKVHIIGGPGSGKTTLAQCIAARYQVPHYNLDKVDWKQVNEVDIAEQPGWVTEGIYLIFTEAMLYHADYIVLLHAPLPVLMQRMVRRHVLNSLRGTQDYPGLNGIKLLIHLMKGTRRYYLNQSDKEVPSAKSLHDYIEQHAKIADPPTKEFVSKYVSTYGEFIIPPTAQFVTDYLERYKEKLILINDKAGRERFLALLTQ